MTTYNTIEAALGTKKVVIAQTTPFTYKGKNRLSIYVKKANGKRFYNVVKYENGTFSKGV